MISIKWFPTENISALIVSFSGGEEAGEAFQKGYDEAKKQFGDWSPLDIWGCTQNSRGFLDNDFIVITQGSHAGNKRKRKRVYPPSGLEPSCSRRDRIHK